MKHHSLTHSLTHCYSIKTLNRLILGRSAQVFLFQFFLNLSIIQILVRPPSIPSPAPSPSSPAPSASSPLPRSFTNILLQVRFDWKTQVSQRSLINSAWMHSSPVLGLALGILTTALFQVFFTFLFLSLLHLIIWLFLAPSRPRPRPPWLSPSSPPALSPSSRASPSSWAPTSEPA